MRRTTLGPVSSSQLNSRSSVLRHPSTRVSVPSKTATAFDRQSIGVASRRISTATGLTGRRPPIGPRASVKSRQSVSTNRRNSSYSSRTSVSGRGGARVLDPRPVNDRSYLNSCVQTLVEFLSEHMYDQTLPPALLRRGPSKKDFYNMILFLFKLVDPTFEFGIKFEEDVVHQFRNLRYPIHISKTSLSAVGTPHTWPTLLLSISWLIELLSYDEAIQQANETDQNDENDEENGDKPFFRYLSASYHAFLAGEDDRFDILEKQEREKLIARNEVVREEINELELQREEFKKRIDKAKRDKNALSVLQSKKSDCESDLYKFRKIVQGYEKAKFKLEKKMESLAQVKQSFYEEFASRQSEIQRLQTRIDNQELSAHDIEQIGQERARLTEQLHQVLARQEDFQRRIKNDENRAAEIRDDLDAQIYKYMNTCKQLKIIPIAAKYSLKFDFVLEIDPNLQELDAIQKLTHYLKTEVRQAALALKQNRIACANAGLDKALVLDNKLQQCEIELNNEIQNEKKQESKVKKYVEQMPKQREKQAENLRRKTAAIEEIEKTITNIANEDNLAEEEALSRQRLQEMRKASVEMTEAYHALLDKNRHVITNVLITCTNHKAVVDRAISSLEAEVNKIEL
ncbi:Centromere-associated protein HEC1 [Plasmopara halstedii]|uniref:Kinetochore protein NDC80 n=1 Tax=Plasmopara halstedii TaxID=4781 RepID=A0A0P1B664_PLAHL|nr:Centromere-associated protein HEC1 [Plasmopara halstedii]CEG49573.1 Centromere-associated protein HEC1 [Plasmopara halstedii]|eukprot:XP_024585942.1 Centromere-associated protein HEC1 [Plasmopara halstedii]